MRTRLASSAKHGAVSLVAKPLRNIIREPRFESELAALFDDPETADDYTLGAEFLLAHDPEIGSRAVSEGSVWILPMAPIGENQITLYYTFDVRTVWFLSIRAF